MGSACILLQNNENGSVPAITTIPYMANECNQYTKIGGLLVSSDANGNLTSDQNGNTYTSFLKRGGAIISEPWRGSDRAWKQDG